MKIPFISVLAFLFFSTSIAAAAKPGCDDLCMEKKALLGDGEAALELGDSFLYSDRVKMKYWYGISAENGSALGAYNFAHFLVVDSSSADDCYRAIYWFGMAAKRGHKLSRKRHDALVSGLSADDAYKKGCLDQYSK